MLLAYVILHVLITTLLFIGVYNIIFNYPIFQILDISNIKMWSYGGFLEIMPSLLILLI